MHNFTIARHERAKTTLDPTGEVYLYNADRILDDFPTIQARIHPFFVIQSAYLQFQRGLVTPGSVDTYGRALAVKTLWDDLLSLPPESEDLKAEEEEVVIIVNGTAPTKVKRSLEEDATLSSVKKRIQ